MLTPTQLTAISRYLKKSGIIYEEVHDELVDHFINAIEAQMANQTGFDEALVDVGRQFGCRQGLTYIQSKQAQATNKQYNQSLIQYARQLIRWPNFPVTAMLVWLIYTLVRLAPTMLTITYTILVISVVPFLIVVILLGKHLGQYMRHKRPVAWSLEGGTLFSRSFATLSISVYPSLFVAFGLITPKQTPLSTGEQTIFFGLSCLTLFLVYAQLNMLVRYAKTIDKPLTRLS